MRHLFVAMTAMGLLMFVAINSAVVAAMGIFVTMLCAWLFVKLRASGDPHILAPATALLGIVVLWFSACDYSSTEVRCLNCQREHEEYRVRLLGLPVFAHRTEYREVFLSLVDSDLGRPCVHELASTQNSRLWGLFVSEMTAREGYCQHGRYVSTPEWYTDDSRQRIRNWRHSKPVLFEELCAEHAKQHLWEVVSRIETELRYERSLEDLQREYMARQSKIPGQ
ncbi:hypothetical protein NA78x_004861 [Anatilimnocola sp. NA78]|uniref:hypothetical protein n=1 Tax=Anatilimnocola sp. NA78 TaxID=3415683 RepID=UPI003CE4C806